jgi:predicted RNase H-like nuclease (RuvC/YqgF family)
MALAIVKVDHVSCVTTFSNEVTALLKKVDSRNFVSLITDFDSLIERVTAAIATTEKEKERLEMEAKDINRFIIRLCAQKSRLESERDALQTRETLLSESETKATQFVEENKKIAKNADDKVAIVKSKVNEHKFFYLMPFLGQFIFLCHQVELVFARIQASEAASKLKAAETKLSGVASQRIQVCASITATEKSIIEKSEAANRANTDLRNNAAVFDELGDLKSNLVRARDHGQAAQTAARYLVKGCSPMLAVMYLRTIRNNLIAILGLAQELSQCSLAIKVLGFVAVSATVLVVIM